MRHTIRWYFEDWTKVMFRPIYFFTFMEKGPWSERSVTFLLISSWILAFGISVVGFLAYVVPMFSVLIKGISGVKFLLALPVFLLLHLTFFAMIFVIGGSVLIAAAFLGFYVISLLLNYIAGRLGGEGSLGEIVKAAYYSGAVFLPMLLIPVIALSSKYGLIPRQSFAVGINLVLCASIFYWWGLWSIALKKVYGISRQKAVWGTFMVIILMLLLQVAAGLKVIPLLERWFS